MLSTLPQNRSDFLQLLRYLKKMPSIVDCSHPQHSWQNINAAASVWGGWFHFLLFVLIGKPLLTFFQHPTTSKNIIYQIFFSTIMYDLAIKKILDFDFFSERLQNRYMRVRQQSPSMDKWGQKNLYLSPKWLESQLGTALKRKPMKESA